MKNRLTVLLTVSALNLMSFCLADSVPWAAVVANARNGDAMAYDQLYTECAWQGLALSDEVMTALGDPQRVVLKVADLPSNVTVSVRPGHTGNVIGLKITRKDKTEAIHQVGRFTLTNPVSGYSYTVQAMIAGSERPAK